MKPSKELDGVPCASGGGHDIVRSYEGPAPDYEDGQPYCRRCGICDFGLTDADVPAQTKEG